MIPSFSHGQWRIRSRANHEDQICALIINELASSPKFSPRDKKNQWKILWNQNWTYICDRPKYDTPLEANIKIKNFQYMRIQSCLDLNQWPEYGFSMTITSGLIITTYTSCGGQAQTCHEPMVIYLFFFSPRGNSGAMQGAKELSTWITFKKNQCGRTGAAITVIHFSERHKVFLSDRNWTKQSKDSHEKSEACTYDITAERITGNKQIKEASICIYLSVLPNVHGLTATDPEARKSFTGTFLARSSDHQWDLNFWRHYLWQPIAITRSRAQVWVFHLPNHWSSIDSCCSLHLLTATMLSATLHSCLHFAASFFMWL